MDEENLILIARNAFYIFNLKEMNLIQEISLDKKEKITDLQILNYKTGMFIFLGLETGEVLVYSKSSLMEDEKYLAKFKAYDMRVKKIACVGKYLVTISTEGHVSIWDIEEILEVKEGLEHVF